MTDTWSADSNDLDLTFVEINEMNHSSAFEKMIETAFLRDLLGEMWFGRGEIVDVMHSSLDAFGFDLVLETSRALRHVQLKARRRGGKNARLNINTRLAERASGCVVWMEWAKVADQNALEIEYRWFGGAPGDPLPPLGDRAAKHAKANAQGVKNERSGIRVLPLGQLERLEGIAEVADRLFGPRA
ncbi:hypothetical protein [Aeromicrobium yanjiei]|uniref:DUF4365 domain-containing protein n=1 Tax=Aeromicrobium yanjiei TaxID=2662028 RepID=A0A5Q2MP51_9ACTN|nr:hypothetical protein [Aeromicrobium yanjiei]QGG41850.1 hypothetical protein GEV26_11005 [Aeromicrobium yanjiei]